MMDPALVMQLVLVSISALDRALTQQTSIYLTLKKAHDEGRNVTPEEVAASWAEVGTNYEAFLERFKTTNLGVI